MSTSNSKKINLAGHLAVVILLGTADLFVALLVTVAVIESHQYASPLFYLAAAAIVAWYLMIPWMRRLLQANRRTAGALILTGIVCTGFLGSLALGIRVGSVMLFVYLSFLAMGTIGLCAAIASLLDSRRTNATNDTDHV